jgi:DNA-binding NarL/FixJ family response regulator
MTKITVALAEAERLTREGYRCLLTGQKDFEIVGEAAEGFQAIRLVVRVKPRLLITGVAMLGVNGLDVAKRVREVSSETRVLIVSRYRSAAYVSRALRNGASGYVVKDARAAQLTRAIRTVVAGRRYLSPELAKRLVAGAPGPGEDAAAVRTYESLTDREREVFQLTAEGYRSAQIADRLAISHRTVEAHRASAMRKLGVRNAIDLVRYALTVGVLPFEPTPV